MPGRCGCIPIRWRGTWAGAVEREVAVTEISDLKVPNALRSVFEEVIGITDAVCLAILDEEYADLARRAAAKLARKRPSPLLSGRRTT